MTGSSDQLDIAGWKSAWATFVNRDVDDILVSLQSERRRLQTGYVVLTTIITTSATQATTIQALISNAITTDTLAADLYSSGGPDIASATISAPTIGALVTYSPPPPPPPPPASPAPESESSAASMDGSANQAASDGTEGVPIGVIAGVVAGAVAMSAVTGFLVYKRTRRSKQPRATLASPVPVEMMPPSSADNLRAEKDEKI